MKTSHRFGWVIAALLGVSSPTAPLELWISGDAVAAETEAGAATDDAAGNPKTEEMPTQGGEDQESSTSGAFFDPSPDIPLSPGVAEVVELARSNVDQDVLLAFVRASDHAYELSVEEIIYLDDIGIPMPVISAMIREGADRRREEGYTPATHQLESRERADADPPAGAKTEAAPPEEDAVSELEPEPGNAPATDTKASDGADRFYSELKPYGTWRHLDDFGWCWKPSVAAVHSDWRPYYTRGQWLYTDHGWYWQSDYSWGWIPFHYGRWHHHGVYGWVWVPGTVWAPSWVTWRVHHGYAGWAPLPPHTHYHSGIGFSYRGRRVGFNFHFGLGHHHYTFVRFHHLHHHRFHRHTVRRDRVHQVFKDSKVVNNIAIGDNNTIINEGIGRKPVEDAIGEELRQVDVRELPEEGTTVKPDRLVKRDSDFVLYRKPIDQIPSSDGAIARSRAAQAPRGDARPARGEADTVSGPTSGSSTSRSGATLAQRAQTMTPQASESRERQSSPSQARSGVSTSTIRPTQSPSRAESVGRRPSQAEGRESRPSRAPERPSSEQTRRSQIQTSSPNDSGESVRQLRQRIQELRRKRAALSKSRESNGPVVIRSHRGRSLRIERRGTLRRSPSQQISPPRQSRSSSIRSSGSSPSSSNRGSISSSRSSRLSSPSSTTRSSRSAIRQSSPSRVESPSRSSGGSSRSSRVSKSPRQQSSPSRSSRGTSNR